MKSRAENVVIEIPRTPPQSLLPLYPFVNFSFLIYMFSEKMAAQSTSISENNPYSEYHQRFQSAVPQSEEEWLSRASEISQIFSKDAAKRDIDNKTPRDEVSLLKSSGLLKILGPKKYGGGGQSWDIGYKVIREVAKGDGSLGMLLGYHLLWSTTANVVGTDEQIDRLQKEIIENNYFMGGK